MPRRPGVRYPCPTCGQIGHIARRCPGGSRTSPAEVTVQAEQVTKQITVADAIERQGKLDSREATVVAGFLLGPAPGWGWLRRAVGALCALLCLMGCATRATPRRLVQAVVPITMGETAILGSTDSNNGNLLLVQSATLAQQGTITSVSFYVRVVGGQLVLGVYDATGSGGGPGALKATTASFTPVLGWNTQPVTAPVVLPIGTYWLAYFPSSSTLGFWKGTSASSSGRLVTRTFGALPATFPTTGVSTTPSHWSLYASLDPAPTTLPLGATGVAVTTSAFVSSLHLTWTDNSINEDGFRIERRLGTTFPFAEIGTVGPNVTSYVDSGLASGSSYCYQVRAYNTVGNSGYTNIACAAAP